MSKYRRIRYEDQHCQIYALGKRGASVKYC